MRPKEAPPETVRLDRRDALLLGSLLVAAGLVRVLYLGLLHVPLYDPWRHLALLRNLREGLGFTLFDGQPYLWYSPVWYELCAALPRAFGMQWVAGFCSWLTVAVVYLLLRVGYCRSGRRAAVAGALLMAAAGPVVRFTCHYGPEALALLLCLGALLLVAGCRSALSALAAGLAFGTALVLRLNFAFDALLFVPFVRAPRRIATLAGGTVLPLALTWWRNHRIIAAHPWVFTWDGLATRSADFDPVSTLVVQMHPAVRAALRRLHEIIVPNPEWIRGPQGIAWGALLFVVLGLVGVALSRRAGLILATAAAFVYFLLLDRGLSSHFFRIYLPVFPAFFLGLAMTAERLDRGRAAGKTAAVVLVALLLAAGAPMLRPAEGPPLELVTPPEGLLDGPAYAVNSGFYHPESLVYRYPGLRFVGLPLEPESFADFNAAFPAYDRILWHDFSVQPELARYLAGPAGYRVAEQARNAYGREYMILQTTD